MKRLSTLVAMIVWAATAATAQFSEPNENGVSMGHVHYFVPDVDRTAEFWEALGGSSTNVGIGELITFPGIALIISEGEVRQNSLEAIFGPSERDPGGSGPRWFSFTLRRGRGPSGSISAAGASTERLWETTRHRFGGEVEVWTRPDHPIGGGARLHVSRTRGALRNLFLDVGVKSDGHWPGRPAGVGPFVRLGLRVDR